MRGMLELIVIPDKRRRTHYRAISTRLKNRFAHFLSGGLKTIEIALG